MNRAGHIIYSEFILILGMGGFLLYLLNDYGLRSVSIAILLSIATYLLGCIAPDFDHQAVQQKSILLRWMKNITKHRGHWHSIFAMLLYGALLVPIFCWIMVYWYFPVITGMFGFFTHLLLDELRNLKTHAKRAIKLF
jgi:hypothetical protein